MDWLPVALVVVLAMGFTYTNGFHDAANAIATSVSTRALTPRIALGLAAVMNLLGGFAGVRVAQTIGGDIIEVPMGGTGVAICAGALIGATLWNMLTWWRGLPSSSSHALIGGLCGAALAGGATVKWDSMLDNVVIPMVVSPVLGLVGGFALMTGDPVGVPPGGPRADGARVPLRADRLRGGDGVRARHAGCREDRRCRRPRPRRQRLTGPPATCRSRGGPSPRRRWCSASARTPGGGGSCAPWAAASSTSSAPQGFAAETTAAAVLYAATATGAPISTTHVITSAIMGVGATRSRKAVRWGVARSIVNGWLLTFPGAGLAAAVAYAVLALTLPLTRPPAAPALPRPFPTSCDLGAVSGRRGAENRTYLARSHGASGSTSR